jgi:membrane protein YdbS with pleckstrin-like domain
MGMPRAPGEEVLIKVTSGRFGGAYIRAYGILAVLFLIGLALLLYGPLVDSYARFLPASPSSFSLYIMAAAVILAIPVEVERRSLKYVITNFRLVEVSGLLRKRATALQASQINDVQVSQSFLDRIRGHGDVMVRTGTTTMKIRAVPNPGRIEALLMRHASGSAPQADGGSLEGPGRAGKAAAGRPSPGKKAEAGRQESRGVEPAQESGQEARSLAERLRNRKRRRNGEESSGLATASP